MLNDTEFSRKIYKELCEEFGDNFLEQSEKSVFERTITAKDIVKYSSEEIDAIQKEYDKENCREIFQAYVEHRINQEEVLFLLNYYRDGMKAYREVYRGLYEIYGIPEQIACMNQLNGELEMHIQKIPHVDAKKNRIITVRENVVTNYSLKEVTPFTCMRLEYRDNEVVGAAPVVSGTVIVTKMEGFENSYVFEFDLLDDIGNRLTGTYSGSIGLNVNGRQLPD